MEENVVITAEEEQELRKLAQQKLDAMSEAEISAEGKSEKNAYVLGSVFILLIGIAIGIPLFFTKHIFWIVVGVLAIVIGIAEFVYMIKLSRKTAKQLVFDSIFAKLYCELREKKRKELEIKKEKAELCAKGYPNEAVESGFVVGKTIPLKDEEFFKKGNASLEMLIDDAQGKFVFKKSMAHISGYSKTIDYSSIIKYEVYENDKSVVQGTEGSALLGGLLFGATGAIIGASHSQSVIKTVTSLRLILYINSFEMPKMEFDYINGSVSANSTEYNEMIKNLQEVAAYLEYMINNEKRNKSAS